MSLYTLKKLKYFYQIIILISCVSCTKQVPKESVFLLNSEFNLTRDLTQFKQKMTKLDTIVIWFNHSVCTKVGYEKMEITKKKDSIKIVSLYKDDFFSKDSEWKFVYEKQISEIDTVWKMEDFLINNMNRQCSNEKEFGTLRVSHNENRIHYFTKGLIDLNYFMMEYYNTMKQLHPENLNNIYGIDFPSF